MPNNSGGTTYDVLIDNGHPSDILTYDVNGTVINSLRIRDIFQDSASGRNLTTGFLDLAPSGAVNWTHGGTLTTGGYNQFGGLGVSVKSSTFNVNGDFFASNGGVSIQDSSMRVDGTVQLFQSSDNTFANSSLKVGVLSIGEGSVITFNNSNVSAGSENGAIGNQAGSWLQLNHSTMTSGSINSDLGDYVFLTQGSILSVGGITNSGGLDVSNSIINVAKDFSNDDRNGFSSPGRVDLSNGSSLVVKGLFSNGGLNLIPYFELNGSGNSATFGSVHNDGEIQVDPGSSFTVTTGGMTNTANGTFTLGGTGNISGGFTNAGGAVLLNPTANLVADTYSQSSGSTDISGKLRTGAYTQSGGSTTVETGGKLTTNSFNATGGTVTVNGTLDPATVNFATGTNLQGTGTIVGNVVMAGTLMPGLPGTPGAFTVTGNYQQLGQGTLVDLMSPLSQSLLNVSGNVVLGPNSILQINLLNGFNPLGLTFDVMNYNALFGQFSNGTSFWGDGYLWNVSYSENEIEVTAVSATPEPSSFLFLGLGLLVFMAMLRRKNTFRFSQSNSNIA